ncbi:MAG: TGS domain-containing protein [Nitrososphaeria archaeon]
MVTNLPEEVRAIWSRAILTKDPKVKLELLRQVYSKMPKHKGTENLQMNLKRQIASLEVVIEEQERKAKKKGSGGLEWAVRKTGFPQLSVVGTLGTSARAFELMTGLRTEPFRLYGSPQVGIYEAGDVPFQVVWSPVVGIGRLLLGRTTSVLQNADLLLLASADARELEDMLGVLDEIGVIPRNEDLEVDVRATASGGIIISGNSEYLSEEEVREYLRGIRIYNAQVKLSGHSKLDDLEAALLGRRVKKFIKIGYGGRFDIGDLPLMRDEVASEILRTLGLIRVYTKPPDEDVKKPPLVIARGSTVRDATLRVHRQLVETFRFARLWRAGSSSRVGLDYVLQDMDIVEIRA